MPACRPNPGAWLADVNTTSIEPGTPPPPDFEVDRAVVVVAIYGHLTAATQAYLQTAITLNVTILSITSIATGYLLSLAHDGVHRLAVASLPVVMSLSAAGATLVLGGRLRETAAIVRRLDDVLGVFTPNGLVPGAALYPEPWRIYGTKHWHESIFVIFVTLQLVLGTLSTALIMIR